jgi:hypothetical protein
MLEGRVLGNIKLQYEKQCITVRVFLLVFSIIFLLTFSE